MYLYLSFINNSKNKKSMKTNFTNPSLSYVAPEMEVTEIVSEGVLCGSTAAPDWDFDDPLA